MHEGGVATNITNPEQKEKEISVVKFLLPFFPVQPCPLLSLNSQVRHALCHVLQTPASPPRRWPDEVLESLVYWYTFGVKLGLPSHKLDMIQKDHYGNLIITGAPRLLILIISARPVKVLRIRRWPCTTCGWRMISRLPGVSSVTLSGSKIGRCWQHNSE